MLPNRHIVLDDSTFRVDRQGLVARLGVGPADDLAAESEALASESRNEHA